MIVTDIETTGLDPIKHCMASLGAVDYDTGEEFYIECHVPDGKEIDQIALGVNGFTLAQLKDFSKPSPYQAWHEFVIWAKGRDNVLGGHNVGSFDLKFLEQIHRECGNGMKFPFSFRTVDLHSIAYAKFKESLTHAQICIKLGLTPEPKPHNGLEGAKSEYLALQILMGDVWAVA